MQVGKLRHSIKLQHRTESQAPDGSVTYTWTTYATVWAAIKPISGKEAFIAEQAKVDADYEITIRYNSAVISTDRVLFGARIFDINYPKNIEERNEWLILLCKEAV
jgi:SPP1 family predicted phage head-tail adaptor